jgi:hypothetical protein
VVNATASPWGHRTVCSKLHVKRGAGDWKPQWIALGAVRVGFERTPAISVGVDRTL